MSEEFKKIKNEINGFRQAAENKKESEKRATEERIKKEELILEKSGVRQLFEEIRKSGLVKWRNKTADELRNRKIFFRSYEENLDYYPAIIDLSRYYHEGVYVASLLLKFDYWGFGGSDTSGCKEVRVIVVGEELCCRQDHDNYSYAPIKEGELAKVIAKALKNPRKVS